MGIRGLYRVIQSNFNYLEEKYEVNDEHILIFVDAYNVLFEILKSRGNYHCDINEFIQYCEEYLDLLDHPNIKYVWYFDGPADLSKSDTLYERQKQRYDEAQKAYQCLKSGGDTYNLSQTILFDVLPNLLKQRNIEVNICSSECDEILLHYALIRQAYILSNDSDFITHKNIKGVIRIDSFYRFENKLYFKVMNHEKLLNLLGLDEEMFVILIYLQGNDYVKCPKYIIDYIVETCTGYSTKVYPTVQLNAVYLQKMSQLYRNGKTGEESNWEYVLSPYKKTKEIQQIKYDIQSVKDVFESIKTRNVENSDVFAKQNIPKNVISLCKFQEMYECATISVVLNYEYKIVYEKLYDFMFTLLSKPYEKYILISTISKKRNYQNQLSSFIKLTTDPYTIERILELRYSGNVDYVKLFKLFFKLDLSNIPLDYYFYFLIIKFLFQFNNVKHFDTALKLCLTCPNLELMNYIENINNNLSNSKIAEIVRIHLDLQNLSRVIADLLWLMNIPCKYDLEYMKRLSRCYIIHFISILNNNKPISLILPKEEKEWKDKFDYLEKITK